MSFVGPSHFLLNLKLWPPNRLPEADFVRFPISIDSTESIGEDEPEVQDDNIASLEALNTASPSSSSAPDDKPSSDAGDGVIGEGRAEPPLAKGREDVANVPRHLGWPRCVECVIYGK